jgi:hypothetical protein
MNEHEESKQCEYEEFLCYRIKANDKVARNRENNRVQKLLGDLTRCESREKRGYSIHPRPSLSLKQVSFRWNCMHAQKQNTRELVTRRVAIGPEDM